MVHLTFNEVAKQLKKNFLYLILSGFSAGLCLAMYGAALVLVGLFALIFLYDKRFKDFLLFSIFSIF